MFPGRGNIRFPRGLSPPQEPFPSAEQMHDALDLETSTQKALEEWNGIMQAFQLFKSSLGPDFDPLNGDTHPPEDSPFGPALTYRAYAVAGIWMNFYMGLVILHRAHPSMPPFAMVAAHMIAKETDPYANEIGRIAAGVAGNLCLESVVSAPQSSALIECCFPIFVGAVQVGFHLSQARTVSCPSGTLTSPCSMAKTNTLPQHAVSRKAPETMGDQAAPSDHTTHRLADGGPDRQRL